VPPRAAGATNKQETRRRTLNNQPTAIDTNLDPFALDVEIIVDRGATGAASRCTTNDGCAPTCASSCASRG